MQVNALQSFLAQIGIRRLLVMGLVAAAVLGGLAFVSTRMSTEPMAYLFSNLEPTEAQSITEKLRGLNVPFELNADGSAIMVPTDQVRELRMQLAGEGMTGAIGYELLDNQSTLGTTAFLQSVNHARAIEGELARTIRDLESVQEARVHLVLPQRQLFEQEARKPSASITLKTRGKLTPGQVNAIRQLVASAVPDLDPGMISIVDQSGTLLARAADGDDAAGLIGNLQERQLSVEAKMRQEIEAMIERIVGPGRVRAEVSVELETEQTREESEVYDPDKQVVARSTTVERNDQNQDGQVGGAVSVGNALPEQRQDAANNATSQSSSGETSEQVDYANSRTRKTTVKESGAIKRISVAVLVDGTYAKAQGGKTNYAPRSAEELQKFSRLVQSAVGFNEDRGDTVVVENIRFVTDDTPAVDAEALPLGLEKSDMMRLVEIGITALLALIALLFVFRPMVNRLLGRGDAGNTGELATADGVAQLEGPEQRLALAPPSSDDDNEELAKRASQGDERALDILREKRSTGQAKLSIESEIDVAQIEGKVKGSALKKVGEVVARHPAESAAIIRQWMYS
jgi:flagellar M-ring protein FliF